MSSTAGITTPNPTIQRLARRRRHVAAVATRRGRRRRPASTDHRDDEQDDDEDEHDRAERPAGSTTAQAMSSAAGPCGSSEAGIVDDPTSIHAPRHMMAECRTRPSLRRRRPAMVRSSCVGRSHGEGDVADDRRPGRREPDDGVERVLRPDQLSDELREKILAAADELGYVGPDPPGRALARGRPARSACCSPTRSQTPSPTGGDRLPRRRSPSELAPDRARAHAADLRRSATTSSPPATCRSTARSCTRATRTRRRSTGCSAAGCRSCSSTRTRRAASPASTSTTGAAPGRPPSTSSTSVTGGSRIVSRTTAGPAGIVDDPLAAIERPPTKQRMLGWLDALEPAGVEPDASCSTEHDGPRSRVGAAACSARQAPTGRPPCCASPT